MALHITVCKIGNRTNQLVTHNTLEEKSVIRATVIINRGILFLTDVVLPATLNIAQHFYPLGNTAPTNLTQPLPPGEQMPILYSYNVVFEIYHSRCMAVEHLLSRVSQRLDIHILSYWHWICTRLATNIQSGQLLYVICDCEIK